MIMPDWAKMLIVIALVVIIVGAVAFSVVNLLNATKNKLAPLVEKVAVKIDEALKPKQTFSLIPTPGIIECRTWKAKTKHVTQNIRGKVFTNPPIDDIIDYECVLWK